MQKRLDKLDAPLRAERDRAAYVIALHTGIRHPSHRFTRAQETILSWPRILGLDEWEGLAAASQSTLIAASAEDRAKPEIPVVTTVETDPHRESEKLYQQDKKDREKVLRAYVDAKQAEVRRATSQVVR